MTEAEWLACQDPDALLDYLNKLKRWDCVEASGRKLRLLACCVRDRWWPSMDDARSRAALEMSERFAGRLASEEELEDAARAALAAVHAAAEHDPGDARYRAAELALWAAYPGPAHNWAACIWGDDKPTLCARVRDIFGNPFRPVAADPAWLTSTVVALASQVYESRDFSAMPILADALQDAGCDSADVLEHCRDPKATHVRGCWVVDLVLGKS